MVFQVLLMMLYACGDSVVYRDNFDSTPVGEPPGPPQIGSSSVNGDVLVAANPFNDVSPDHWLQLRRESPGTSSQYVATLEEPLTVGGSVGLVGYVSAIPASDPIAISVYFDIPDLTPPPPTPPPPELLHIDLLANGNIRVNDSTVEGTYAFNTSIAFLVTFNLDASPPTATLLIRGSAEDANATVQIPTAAANVGLGRVRVQTANFTDVPKLGLFFIDDMVATSR